MLLIAPENIYDEESKKEKLKKFTELEEDPMINKLKQKLSKPKFHHDMIIDFDPSTDQWENQLKKPPKARIREMEN